jgi:hypothetical protein
MRRFGRRREAAAGVAFSLAEEVALARRAAAVARRFNQFYREAWA